MRYTSAPGARVAANDNASIDYSNVSEGYIVAAYTGDPMKKCRLRVEQEAQHQLQHFTLPGDGQQKAIPLCYGDGDYKITVFQQVKDHSYKQILKLQPAVALSNPLIPWLYPNTYSEYGPGSICVQAANVACKGKQSNISCISAICKWICDNVEYDKLLAKQLAAVTSSWWLPDPDRVIREGKCICWGYSSLFAAMCRSQGIPCKICVGWAQSSYHAWNEVYSAITGNVAGINIKKEAWTRMDITLLDSTAPNVAQFISNDNNYNVEYYG